MSVDRAVLAEDETIALTLRLQTANAPQPDWRPLEKDFEIISTAQHNSLNIVNGSINSTTEWRVILSPKRQGQLAIPALHLGRDQTEPISIRVNKARGGSASAKDVFMEVSVLPQAPYVQSQVLYTVRIYYAVPIREATLEVPAIEQTLIERLGEDINYETKRNGKHFRVIERRYAIFPQQSGKLSLPLVRFSGQIPDTRDRDLAPLDANSDLPADLFESFFSASRPIRLKSSPITLTVRPRPTNTEAAEWLPAQRLTLADTWKPSPPSFRVGVPVTRIVTVQAEGLSGTQLPEMTMPAMQNMKIYPGENNTKNQAAASKIIGRRTQTFTYVPMSVGKQTLPEFRIAWWNAARDKQQEAILPATVVDVLPALTNGNKVANASKTLPEFKDAGKTATAPSATRPPAAAPVTNSSYSQFIWMLIPSLLIGIVIFVVFKRKILLLSAFYRRKISKKIAIKNIHNACEQQNPTGARNALLSWAQLHWPKRCPTTLAELAKRVDHPAAALALQQLDEALYAKTVNHQWDGLQCWRAIKPIIVAENVAINTADSSKYKLPELYSS